VISTLLSEVTWNSFEFPLLTAPATLSRISACENDKSGEQIRNTQKHSINRRIPSKIFTLKELKDIARVQLVRRANQI
jgi:hypothetical protein